jgi:hypothetical protein
MFLLVVVLKTGLLNLKVKVTNLPALTSPLASASIVSVGAAVESSACIELESHSIGLHTRPTFVSQWVKSASASSNTSLAGRLTDDPESTLGNRQQLNDPNSWIEAKATSINGTNYGAKPNLTLTYRTPIYIQYIVIRETFNTREGGQDVWGIDSVSRPAKEVLLLALALLTHCDTNVGLVCNPILWLFAAFSLALTPITESARTGSAY